MLEEHDPIQALIAEHSHQQRVSLRNVIDFGDDSPAVNKVPQNHIRFSESTDSAIEQPPEDDQVKLPHSKQPQSTMPDTLMEVSELPETQVLMNCA